MTIGHLTEHLAGTAQMLGGEPSQSQCHRGLKVGLKVGFNVVSGICDDRHFMQLFDRPSLRLRSSQHGVPSAAQSFGGLLGA
jgi:hypothetical protein